MSDLPSTITSPSAFLSSPASGFDGVFDWSWTHGCFGETKITPMDFDGVVERRGNFLVFETKGVGVDVPRGQLFALQEFYKIGVATLLFVQGKVQPEFAMVWCQPGFKAGKQMRSHEPIDRDRAANFVREWYAFADKTPSNKVDVTLLQRRVVSLTEAMTAARANVEVLVGGLGGRVSWE